MLFLERQVCLSLFSIKITLERHPLFQDSSRLSQLIGQLTSTHEDAPMRATAAQMLHEYIHEPAHLEVSPCNPVRLTVAKTVVLEH